MRLAKDYHVSFIEWPGRASVVVYTVGCNFRCLYCYNDKLVFGGVETISPEEFLNEIDSAFDAVPKYIVVTGGEPTIHGNELVNFLTKLKEKGFRIKLETNGSNPGVISDLIGVVDFIQMDIKAPLIEDLYLYITGRFGNVQVIRQSIELIRDYWGPNNYEFRTVIYEPFFSEQIVFALKQQVPEVKLIKYVETDSELVPKELKIKPIEREDYYED